MKRLLLLFVFLLTLSSYGQGKLIASCCDAGPAKTAKDFGRCSGDAYCTACKNCSACKHCSKEGGSCGVCATYEAPKAKTARKKTVKAAKSPSVYRRNQMLEVTSETLNVRDGAGTSYSIVETLSQGDMLTFIKFEGEWIYVRVDASGENGWVKYQFVK